MDLLVITLITVVVFFSAHISVDKDFNKSSKIMFNSFFGVATVLFIIFGIVL